MNWKGKRGEGDTFTLRKVMTIVIAVICVIGLVYLGNKLYSSKKEAEMKERAKGVIDEIVSILSGLNTGESKNYIDSSIDEWYLATFRASENSPSACSGTACLCLCANNDFAACSNVNTGVCKGGMNVVLRDSGNAVQYLQILTPSKNADTRKTRIFLSRISPDVYEIGYTEDKNEPQ